MCCIGLICLNSLGSAFREDDASLDTADVKTFESHVYPHLMYKLARPKIKTSLVHRKKTDSTTAINNKKSIPLTNKVTRRSLDTFKACGKQNRGTFLDKKLANELCNEHGG